MRTNITGVLVLAVVAVAAAPGVAQTGEGPTVSSTLLTPLGQGATGAGQFPSGRFTLDRELRGALSVHAGALHLTPADAGLWAGIAGLRYDFLEGPLRLAPFVDVGYGRAVRRVEAGRVPTSSGDLVRWDETSAGAAGGGAGAVLEWRVRPFLSLSATGGYWHYVSGGDQAAISAPFAGVGVRLDMSGGPAGPIGPTVLVNGPLQIRIEEPAAWSTAGSRGIRAVAKTSIRVVGTVRDPRGAGIREVRLNGHLAALRPLDAAGSLARFVGFVPVTDEVEAVEISAASSDGRWAAESFEVTPTLPRVSDSGAAAAARRGALDVKGRRFAVVIGISDYVDPGIPDLEFADDDARAFYDFLRSENAGLGGIPDQNIRLLVNEEGTYRNMRTALYTFLEQATEDDVVYIYIAAHGAPNPNRPDDLFILPHDAEVSDIAGTGFPMTDVNESIRKLYARHTVLLTDACHSGGLGMAGYATRDAFGENLNAINKVFLQDLQATQSGLAILTASEARQLSREGTQWGGGHGVFTWYLLRGLKGEADADGDHIVRLGELLEYVREGVKRETANGQIPAFGSNAFDRFMPVAVVVPKEEIAAARDSGGE